MSQRFINYDSKKYYQKISMIQKYDMNNKIIWLFKMDNLYKIIINTTIITINNLMLIDLCHDYDSQIMIQLIWYVA